MRDVVIVLGMMSECDPHRRYVEEIRRAGQHAAVLTQQLLTRAGQTPSPPPVGKSPASRALRDLAHDHSGHESILLVEDDEAVRDAVLHELAVLGHSVLEAGDGPEALRVAATVSCPNRTMPQHWRTPFAMCWVKTSRRPARPVWRHQNTQTSPTPHPASLPARCPRLGAGVVAFIVNPQHVQV